MTDDEHTPARPIPPRERDAGRLERARERREAEGETSLGDEAIDHAQSIPEHREPGATGTEAESGRATRTGEEIARDAANSAGSAAQVGKPLAPRGRRD
ncbi:MAG: hypothetical protein ACFE0R_09925 [Salinarimonas sp.]